LPIEIAAVRGKREVVEKLYPLTSPVPIISDWSIDGLFRHVESPIYQIEVRDIFWHVLLKSY
jgi:hypothetical protein